MYEVAITNHGGKSFEVESKGYKFNIDTKGEGITPPDTLLASLGSCMGVYLRKYCDGGGLNIESFRIRVSAELVKESPSSFRQISVSIDMGGVQIPEGRKKAMLQFIKNCPIHNTFFVKPAITIDIS